MNNTIQTQVRNTTAKIMDKGDKTIEVLSIPQKEMDYLNGNFNDSTIRLFETYVKRARGKYNGNSLSLSDEKMAEILGWTKRKVSEHRIKLEKEHYFLVRYARTTDRFNTLIELVFLGRAAVSSHLLLSKKQRENEIAERTIVTDYELIEIEPISTLSN